MRPAEMADNIAVRVQETDFGDGDLWQLPLLSQATDSTGKPAAFHSG